MVVALVLKTGKNILARDAEEKAEEGEEALQEVAKQVPTIHFVSVLQAKTWSNLCACNKVSESLV